jgi:hypothetical protein
MLALGLNDLADIESLVEKPIEERLRFPNVFSRIGRHAIDQVQDGHFLRTFDVRRPLKSGVDASSVTS